MIQAKVVADGLFRAGSILRKASVWASLSPARISQYYINAFLFRKVFSKFTFKWRWFR